MKLRIRQLGKIQDAAFDIRPITVFVGENNTNKTWTAYTLYALLKALSYEPRWNLTQTTLTQTLAKRVRALASQTAERIQAAPSSASLNFEFSRETMLGAGTKQLQIALKARAIARVLAVSQKNLKGASAELTIPRPQLDQGSKFFFISVADNRKRLSYGETDVQGTAELVPSALSDSDYLSALIDRQEFRRLTVTFTPEARADWTTTINSLLVEFLLSSLNAVSALPAERKALVALYSKLDRKDTSHLPLPLSDFTETMRQAESYARDSRRRGGQRWKPEFPLSDRIEAILGGGVTFRSTKSGQELVFAPRKNISLPIQSTSSLVRSLTGLLFSGSSMAQRNSALIIDEPEMNAHPSAQLAIVEILAALANLGNYIIITTHSPYVVDHLNNLLAASELKTEAKQRASESFALKTTDSFLSTGNVSAYEFSSKGGVRTILDKKRNRISTDTFGDTSSSLENLYSELLKLADQ